LYLADVLPQLLLGGKGKESADVQAAVEQVLSESTAEKALQSLLELEELVALKAAHHALATRQNDADCWTS